MSINSHNNIIVMMLPKDVYSGVAPRRSEQEMPSLSAVVDDRYVDPNGCRISSKCVQHETGGLFSPTHQCLYKYRSGVGPQRRGNWGTCHVLKFNLKNGKQKSGARAPKQKSSNKPKQSKKQPSLGRTLLRAGLGGLGGFLGPAGAKVGTSLGDWGANLLGMGDYKVEENSLMGNGVPLMHDDKMRTMRIKHREFLGDITGSVGFTSRTYTIQPGSSNTFPWLSRMAELFQSYKVHGMVFTFNSTSADALNSVNTALGTVVMSTQYNVSLPPFTSKAEMEQYEYTVAGRPSRNLTHIIECDPKLQVMDHLFCRSGALPAGQDYQFYDWGTFQFATVGMQAAATIGELWVSYDIEFFKPRIQSGGSWPGDFTFIRNGPYVQNGSVLGVAQNSPVGNLGVTVTSSTGVSFDRITWPEYVTNGRYVVTVYWGGSTAAAIGFPTTTLTNLTLVASNTLSGSPVAAPQAGVAATRAVYQFVVTVNGYASGGSHITFGSGGVLPLSNTEVSISVLAIPLTDTNF